MEENKENKIMWLEREDYCPHCHSRKALMIFDKYNNIINYPMVLDQDKKDIFEVGENSKQFTYMQCNKCGSKCRMSRDPTETKIFVCTKCRNVQL